MPDNPMQARLEHQLTKHAHDQYLEELHRTHQHDELLKAAKQLNDLHYLERIKTDWAIREASQNLSTWCGYDRNPC